MFVSSPVLNDMLKSGTSPYASRTIGTATDTGRLSHAVAFVIAGGAYRSHTGDFSVLLFLVCMSGLHRQALPTTAIPPQHVRPCCAKSRGCKSEGPRAQNRGKIKQDQVSYINRLHRVLHLDYQSHTHPATSDKHPVLTSGRMRIRNRSSIVS